MPRLLPPPSTLSRPDLRARSWRQARALTLMAGVFAGLLWAANPGLALAEKADRSQPIVVEADKRGTVDTQKQITVFTGNVVITQGTLQVRGDRVEIQESADKFRTAVAFGSAQRPAFFKQKREGTEETVEGTAERIDFDEKNDTLRLTGNPVVRRMLDAKMIDEVIGTLITWDNRTEFFTVEGGAPTAASPSGRVRMMLSPRQAASGPAATASSPPKAATPATPPKPPRSAGTAGK
jgi:lipopolysaccharide export system protein LptA